MKQTFTTQKRPIYLIAGIALIPFVVSRLFGDDPDVFTFVVYSLLSISCIMSSGYVYSYRKLVIEEDRITLKNINKERKREIMFSEILRIWENQENIIIDLESEVLEIEKSIFHRPHKVSEALTNLKST